MMRHFLQIAGGVLVALGMVFVCAVGLLYDRAEWERREENKRREKRDGEKNEL